MNFLENFQKNKRIDINQLIKQAEELKSIAYDSPKVDLWKKRTKEFVTENYGEEYVAFLRKSWSWGAIIVRGQAPVMHTKAMSRAIEFLESLKNEQMINSYADPHTSQNLKNDYQIEKLHKSIYEKCFSLFEKKEYALAVEKGFKVVRQRLRELTGYETGAEAFGKGKLHIKGAAETWVDNDFNDGVKFLTMAIDRFRNEKSHTVDGNINDSQRAYEYLCISSLTMNLLENVEIMSNLKT
jgi:uncharacterized protein (TIGR02391 family)